MTDLLISFAVAQEEYYKAREAYREQINLLSAAVEKALDKKLEPDKILLVTSVDFESKEIIYEILHMEYPYEDEGNLRISFDKVILE